MKISLLSRCLEELFKDTGIDYEVMKKYIVLTKADKGKPVVWVTGVLPIIPTLCCFLQRFPANTP